LPGGCLSVFGLGLSVGGLFAEFWLAKRGGGCGGGGGGGGGGGYS